MICSAARLRPILPTSAPRTLLSFISVNLFTSSWYAFHLSSFPDALVVLSYSTSLISMGAAVIASA